MNVSKIITTVLQCILSSLISSAQELTPFEAG